MIVGASGERSASHPASCAPSLAVKRTSRAGIPAVAASGAERMGHVPTSVMARTAGAATQAPRITATARSNTARGVKSLLNRTARWLDIGWLPLVVDHGQGPL